MVSLLVLLDRDPERPELVPPAPAPDRPPPSLWLGGGVALTEGLPKGSSAALLGEAGVRYLGHSLWVGAVWTAERDVGFEPGFIGLSAFGGQLRACTSLFGAVQIRFNGCALGMLLSLQGTARGYTDNSSERRPWWLAGAGLELAFEPEPWLSAAVTGRLLLSPHREVFVVQGLGPGYETETVTGWLGLTLAAKIW